MREVFKSCNPILEIYRNCGQLLKTQNPDIKKKVDKYLGYVKKAGFEIVKNKAVSDELKARIPMELISPDEYMKMMKI